ncbi:hypothetical protein FEK47_22370 [Escherichia sp. E3659]|nr:hypothetical protein FEK47_22370 [Escherichia sp. E3659]
MPGGRGISTITLVTIAEKINGTTNLSYRYRLLTKCQLFIPDAALTPYPTYKIVQIQYIAWTM